MHRTFTSRAAIAATTFAAMTLAALMTVAAAPAFADQGHSHATASEPVAAAPAPAADGAVLYHDYCSVCHGDRGNGDSRARGSMVPPPRDFTTPQARTLSRESMIAAVRDGRAGTAMAPWGTQLSAPEITAVVDYIRDAFISPLDSDTAGEGARLYARTCSVCHGDNGGGAVWATANLDPRPRDFTTTRAASDLSRDRMIHAVTFGRPDTAMPGFGTQLEERQIEAVVDFVRRAFMRTAAMASASAGAADGHGADGHGAAGHGAGGHGAGGHGAAGAADAHAAAAAPPAHHGTAHAPADAAADGGDSARGAHDHDAHLGAAGAMDEPFPEGLVGNLARGEDLYRANCVACHGEQGNGRGPRAYFIMPKPRNFTHPASRSAFNRPHLFQSISRGRVGSEMAAWDTVLDAQAIADVAEYVLQRFILGDPSAGAAPGNVASTR